MVLVHFPRGLLLPLHQLSAIPRLPLHSGFEDGWKTPDRGCSLLFADRIKAARTIFLNPSFAASRQRVRDAASCKRIRESTASAPSPAVISAGSATRRHEKTGRFLSIPPVPTRQTLKRSNLSPSKDGASTRWTPHLSVARATPPPPFRKNDARNLAEACLFPNETEDAGITKCPVFYKKTGNAQDFTKQLGKTAFCEFRRGNGKVRQVSQSPFRK
jgi:hypothetical protein